MTSRVSLVARSSKRLLTMLSLAVLLAASHGCKQEQAAPLPEKPAVLDPLPIPADLIADVLVPNPDAAWAKARVAVGGPAMFLPATTGALAATLCGLPLTAAGEIDGNVPVVGAILEAPEGGKVRAAVGLHLRSPDNFINLITKGEHARHTTRVDDQTKMTLIEPKGGGTGSVALGILGNYLVAAPTSAELLAVGPYVVRNLPTKKMPSNDITFDLPRAALEGPVAKNIRSKWDSVKPRPKADGSAGASLPSPIQGLVDGVLAVVGELDRAKVTLDFDDRAAHVRLVGAPNKSAAAGGSIARMTVGDPKKLLDLPGDSDVALFIHDAPEVRAADAKGYASALAGAIGKDVSDDDRAALESALASLAKSRGNTFAAGLALTSTGPAAYVRSSVADRDQFGKALEDVFKLVERKPVQRWLGELSLGVTTGKTVIEDLAGDVRRVRIERLEAKDAEDKKATKPAPKKKAEAAAAKPEVAPGATPSLIDVLYMFGAEDLVLAAGYDAKAALRAVLDASTKDNLSTRAEAVAAIGALGGKAAFVLYSDPLRLLARQAGKPLPAAGAPVVFALGKGGEGFGADDPWMRLDMANLVIQELVRRRGAL